MIYKSIDSHIHLDMYNLQQQKEILSSLTESKIEALITVSNDLPSAKVNLTLANNHTAVKPAFGFHPEQALPSSTELEKSISLLKIIIIR